MRSNYNRCYKNATHLYSTKHWMASFVNQERALLKKKKKLSDPSWQKAAGHAEIWSRIFPTMETRLVCVKDIRRAQKVRVEWASGRKTGKKGRDKQVQSQGNRRPEPERGIISGKVNTPSCWLTHEHFKKVLETHSSKMSLFWCRQCWNLYV